MERLSPYWTAGYVNGATHETMENRSKSNVNINTNTNNHNNNNIDNNIMSTAGASPSLSSSSPSSSSSSSQDVCLQDVALLDYLSKDNRPTFILSRLDPHIAYRNPALDNHLRAQRITQSAFCAWATSILSSNNDSPTWSLSVADADFGGRRWNSVPLSQRWLVVSASSQDSAPREVEVVGGEEWPAAAAAATVSPPSALSSQIRSRTQSTFGPSVSSRFNHLVRIPSESSESECSTDARRASMAPSVVSSSWKSASEDGGNANPWPRRQLDWTRHYAPGLSSHIQFVQSFPWHETPVGAIHSWPDSLRQLVLAMMSNSEPRVVMYGKERRMIYNEACSVIFAQKHPAAMGARADEIWAESWQGLRHIVSKAEMEGKSTKISKMQLTMYRHGYSEETHWTLQLIPIIGPENDVIGVLDEFSEITQNFIQERRREGVVKINQLVSNVTNMRELCFEFLEGLETCVEDVPFALIYTSPFDSDADFEANSNAQNRFLCEGSVGISPAKENGLPTSFDLTECQAGEKSLMGACKRSWESGEDVVLHTKDGTLPEELAIAVAGRAEGERVQVVIVLPISNISGTGRIVSFLVVAATPRRPYDGEAALFVHYLRDILTKSASAIVLPEEQRRVRQRFEEIETSLAQQLRATALEAEKIEARFVKMSQLAPVGMYAISPNSETVFFNEAYLNITGITRAEAEGSNLDPADRIHPEDRDRVMGQWLKCLEDRQPFTTEYRLVKSATQTGSDNGEETPAECWILANAMPELDENGDVVHIQGWLLDISERKHHEQLRVKRAHNEKSEARFARLAETAPLGMYLLHPDGSPIYLNDAYFDLLGFTRSDFEEAESRGMGWADRVADEDKQLVADAWSALVNDGVPMSLEYRIKKPWKAYDTATGTEMAGPTWLQTTAITEMDDEGNPIAVQGFVAEISLKKFSERLIAERLEDALETKQQADRFIDMTSHELRNPLSAILQSADGILTSLDSSGLPIINENITITSDTAENIVDSAQTIILCAQHQKRIVDDILTLSKLDSNLLVICPDKVSPPALLEKTFKMYEGELVRSNVTATLILEPSYKQHNIDQVMLDSSRLLQVVINLFTNAIKFTQYSDRRQVKVILGASTTRPTCLANGTPYIAQRAHRVDHTATPDWGSGEDVFLQISVEDSGRGLNEDEMKLLFHRFQQASPKTYKQYGGSGLGLFISQELTELQGGQIGVCSEYGKGSTFAFYVKARRYLASSSGMLNLPEGRKQTPTLLSSPVTYAGTGSVTPSEGQDLNTLPQLEKPLTTTTTGGFKSTAVSETEKKATGTTTTSRSRLGQTPASSQKGPNKKEEEEEEVLHILVVEDNLVNQRIMAQQLKRLGCVVHVANHGIEALEFLRQTTFWNPDAQMMQAACLEPIPPTRFSSPSAATPSAPSPRAQQPPSDPVPLSLILMDLEMPVLGGLGCVKQIRDLQRAGNLTSHVPVIAVTANARSEQIAVAISHGMDSVVTKPFRVPDLVPEMWELIQRRKV